MPRKTRRPQQSYGTTQVEHHVRWWPVCAACLLLGMLLGAGGTYLALRPSHHHAAPLASSAPAFPAPNNTASPPAELTAGLPPVEASVRLGDWYEDHQEWTQAIALLTQAITLGADTPDVRTDLGVAYYRNRQPKEALAQYQTAHDANPRHENSLFNQGSVYLLLGRPGNAISVWEDYIRQFPNGQHVSDARLLIKQAAQGGGTSLTPTTPAP